MPTPRYEVFRYLSATEHAEAYRRIMRELAAAKERFIVHLGPDELRHAVPRDLDLASLLTQLVEWGNLKADPDTSRVASVEEFNRARYVYQFTAAGESAERVLADFDRSFGTAGACRRGRGRTSSSCCRSSSRSSTNASSTRRRRRSP